ncbi:MAG: sigma-70 family RNA polymerase sigma factor [Planctomycetota bacterium]|nr:sigma-70 family RNA polymerase sigma factor [Planctomycetota bacterium]
MKTPPQPKAPARPPALPSTGEDEPMDLGRAKVEAALEAEAGFFRNLLRKHLGKILRMRPPDSIDEAVSECFQTLHARALEALHTYNPARPAGPWLVGISLKLVQETYPGRRRAPTSASDLGDKGWQLLEAAPAQFDDPACRLIQNEQAVQVRQALERLPPDDRRLLQLMMYEQLKAPEIAILQGLPVDTIHMRKCRALKRMRDLLAVVPGFARPETFSPGSARPSQDQSKGNQP